MTRTEKNAVAFKVPKLLDDCIEIDVLWDGHSDAVAWYKKWLGWKTGMELDSPEPRAQDGRMTEMAGGGIWLNSVLTRKRLPYHYADRGTVDPNVRWCVKVRDLKKYHDLFSQNGIRVSNIYPGPGGYVYFDFWATWEGTRFTAQGDPTYEGKDFGYSWLRIGVSDLPKSIEWYSKHVGFALHSEHFDEGYVIMKTGVNHQPDSQALVVLEKLPEKAQTGKVDGPVRLSYYIENREEFFAYHNYLKENGVETGGRIGGFTGGGRAVFHFYDPDGTRLNVCNY
jgi:catechol 2,3-dioxygenase-like lactoylglutathione lyase family enzyme